MTADSRHLREVLGALALGALDEDERAAVQAHVDGCASCRAELDHLTRVARRLEVLRDTDVPAGPPAASAEQLFARLARTRRRGRVRLLAAALALSAVAVVFAVRGQQPDEQPSQLVAFTDAPAGVAASAELRDWGWGTQVYLTITGLPADQRLGVWLERPDGSRVSAGTFRTTGGELHVTLGAGASTADAVALGISDAEGTTLLFAPL